MGKKILTRLLEQSNTEVSKKDTSILDSLLGQEIPEKREQALNEGVSESFQGDSKYDKNLGFGINQNLLRARTQPFYDQLGNSIAKVVPGAALAVVESVGDLGELLDTQKDKDYSNIFTELAKKGKEHLEEDFLGGFKTYQEGDPNKLPSLHDSGWWFNFGDGIVQSLAGFYVVGAGLGKGLSLTAKGITGALKTGELGTQIGQGAAQLGTATALSYTEGVQIGGEVYKNVLDQGLKDGLSKDVAKQKASEAAAETVKLNTLLATPLNITGLSSVFKSYSKLAAPIKAQLPRAAGESIPKYIERLSILEKSIPEATGLKDIALATLREGSQEAFEEGGINLYSESEGYRKAGNTPNLVRSNLDDGIERFADILFSEEGAVNALGGAVGGIFQHLGMEHAPLSTYTNPQTGQTQRVSSTKKEQLENNDYKAQLIATLKQDLGTIQKNQQDLNDAIVTGDKTKVEEARNNMFNITALRSIRNETVRELANEVSQYGSVDNSVIGKDGKTDAQRQGLAENIDDNKYKETASRKSADLLKLNKEYRDLQARFQGKADDFTIQQIFRKRLDLYSSESVLQDLNKSALENEQLLSTTLPIQELELAKYKAEQLAFDHAILFQQARKNEEAVRLLKSERVQVDGLYNQLVTENKGLEEKVNNKLNLLQPLVSDYANKLVLNNKVTQQKQEYGQILNNPEQFKKKEVDPLVNEYKKRKEKEEKDQVAKEAKAKQEANYKEAQEKKQKEKEEKQKVQEVINQEENIPSQERTIEKESQKQSSLEAKKADIERRRQEEISKIKPDGLSHKERKKRLLMAKSDGKILDQAYKEAGYVKIGKVWVSPDIAKEKLQIIPEQMWLAMEEAGIGVLSFTTAESVHGVARTQEFDDRTTEEIQLSSHELEKEGLIHVLAHEVGHAIYKTLTEEEKQQFKDFTPVSNYVQGLQAGTLHSGASTQEENFVENFAADLTTRLFGSSRFKVQEQYKGILNKLNAKYDAELAALEESKETTLGIDQLSNLTPVSETYTPPTQKEREEQDNLIDEELTNQNNLNTPSYGNHNKIAYKAQEQDKSGKTVDVFTISNLYKILHSNKIHEGTSLTLKVDTESKFYEENKDSIENIPIGVYYENTLVGYLPIYKGQEKSLLLARNYIVKNKEVTTKVSRKTAGVLNKGDKALVSENYAFTPKFLVGRNGNFELSQDNVFEGDLLNNQSSKSGYLYTLNSTPNGKQIALPVDIDRVDSDLVNSLMKVLDIYFKKGNKTNESTLNEEEKKLIKDIQEEYSQDISTVQGLNWWFNQIFTGTDLSSEDRGKDNIDKISKDQRSKNNYLEIVPAGLRIISNPGVERGTGGSPIIYGRNDINNKDKRAFISKLLRDTHYRADLTKLNSNKEFKLPILNLENNQFVKYSKKTYNEHLASITRTNIVSVNIGNNQQTVFVQPTINLSFEFMEKPTKENLDFKSKDKLKFVSLGKTEKVTLATLDEYNSDDFEQTEETLTEEQKEEYKRKCKP